MQAQQNALRPVGSHLPRQERRRAQRCARLRPPTRAHLSSWSHRRCTPMLTRVCARDAQAMPRSLSPPAPPVSPRHFRRRRCRASSPVAAPVPLQHVLSAVSVRAVAGPWQRPQGTVCAHFWCSFVCGHSGCPWVAGGPTGGAFARIETCLCAVIGVLAGPCV